ncbi:hypothetical protein [Paenibacillus macerans]|uniref:hypothetical protein n=1 Tax=Paenibacillus macerans TaxID=44252 RepID=UPI00203F4ADC|nr:hypothetical protein [Paenibacillus macerans]MCM3699776.1 hypothetical protein [Paenibacillus macerans]
MGEADMMGGMGQDAGKNEKTVILLQPQGADSVGARLLHDTKHAFSIQAEISPEPPYFFPYSFFLYPVH